MRPGCGGESTTSHIPRLPALQWEEIKRLGWETGVSYSCYFSSHGLGCSLLGKECQALLMNAFLLWETLLWTLGTKYWILYPPLCHQHRMTELFTLSRLLGGPYPMLSILSISCIRASPLRDLIPGRCSATVFHIQYVPTGTCFFFSWELCI